MRIELEINDENKVTEIIVRKEKDDKQLKLTPKKLNVIKTVLADSLMNLSLDKCGYIFISNKNGIDVTSKTK